MLFYLKCSHWLRIACFSFSVRHRGSPDRRPSRRERRGRGRRGRRKVLEALKSATCVFPEWRQYWFLKKKDFSCFVFFEIFSLLPFLWKNFQQKILSVLLNYFLFIVNLDVRSKNTIKRGQVAQNFKTEDHLAKKAPNDEKEAEWKNGPRLKEAQMSPQA